MNEPPTKMWPGKQKEKRGDDGELSEIITSLGYTIVVNAQVPSGAVVVGGKGLSPHTGVAAGRPQVRGKNKPQTTNKPPTNHQQATRECRHTHTSRI
jgi:hypothetical protein